MSTDRYTGSIHIDSYSFFFLREEDAEPPANPRPIAGTRLIMSIPNGLYVKTDCYSGDVDLTVQVLERRPPDDEPGWVSTTFEATLGELYVGNFAGPCDTFPHPIRLNEGEWSAQVRKNPTAGPSGHDEHFLVQLWPEESSM